LEGQTSVAHQPRERAASLARSERKRPHYRKELTRVDRRSRIWRRICELTDLYTATLRDAGIELSQIRKMKIEEAAQLKSLAEKARGDFLRDGIGQLSDIVAAERRADLAFRAIGLPKEHPKPLTASVSDILKRVNKGGSPS
jgi:hypothetical protein